MRVLYCYIGDQHVTQHSHWCSLPSVADSLCEHDYCESMYITNFVLCIVHKTISCVLFVLDSTDCYSPSSKWGSLWCCHLSVIIAWNQCGCSGWCEFVLWGILRALVIHFHNKIGQTYDNIIIVIMIIISLLVVELW